MKGKLPLTPSTSRSPRQPPLSQACGFGRRQKLPVQGGLVLIPNGDVPGSRSGDVKTSHGSLTPSGMWEIGGVDVHRPTELSG